MKIMQKVFTHIHIIFTAKTSVYGEKAEIVSKNRQKLPF